MKKMIFLGSLFLGLNFAFAQTSNQNVERDFLNYSRLVSQNKIDEALEYTNPRLFEIFPKENMKNLMEAALKIPNIEYKTSAPTIQEISEAKRIDNVDYIKIKVISPIEMKLTGADVSDENTLKKMQDAFEAKFGAGNVLYDKESGFFKIKATKNIVASSTDGQKNWKFVTVDNPGMKMFLEKIIPAEMLE